ncbi:uncharacterized protein MKZ38_001760 [Zalerion maritima]|uniref:N-alpha-acetyltransferase 40 n=1 Tax=Zalerion maritima TaxID=339359 RepID=A0AAD5RYN1_9PEZI|nr:uncharacterized protein MKZ38_001760 [Zalerion maritima]
MPPVKRKRPPPTPIEIANQKSDEDFIKEYLQPTSSSWTWFTHPKTQTRYTICLIGAPRMSREDLKQCYDLIEHTSRQDYERAAAGWKPGRKMREMKSVELRYLLVLEGGGAGQKGKCGCASEGKDEDGQVSERAGGGAESGGGGEGKGGPRDGNGIEEEDAGRKAGQVAGFSSMMPTYEDGRPVLYCYEIHLGDSLLGAGLGRTLISHLLTIAANIPSVQKLMLSCFLSNARGLAFYRKIGFEEDPYTPGPRLLRGGKTLEPDYVILKRDVEVGKVEGSEKEDGKGE